MLLSVLCNQLLCIKVKFFCEIKYSLGERYFLVGVLWRMCDMCKCCTINGIAVASRSKHRQGGNSNDGAMIKGLRIASRKLRWLVLDKNGLDLSPPTWDDVEVSNNNDMETDAFWSTTGNNC
jgi:hypothetical protein